MAIDWTLMEKIWRQQNPQGFKKSPLWDYKPYELKELNATRSIDDLFVFWEVIEEVYLWDVVLGSLPKLKSWVEEKITEYPEDDVRLEVYTAYTSYPETEEIYCLIRRTWETEHQKQERVELYLKELEKMKLEEKKKEAKYREDQEKQDAIEYARLKEKYEGKK